MTTKASIRERQIWEMLANGRSSKEIAASLDLSDSTIEIYRTRLYKKIGAVNLADATRLAVAHGIIKVEILCPHSPTPSKKP